MPELPARLGAAPVLGAPEIHWLRLRRSLRRGIDVPPTNLWPRREGLEGRGGLLDGDSGPLAAATNE